LDQQGLKQQADGLLADLVKDLGDLPFSSLSGRAQALRGRIKNNLGRPDEAVPLLVKAIKALDSVKDAENGAWARTLLGDSYYLLGDAETCWKYYFVALNEISDLGYPLRELAALNAMSDFLLSVGDDSLALYYQNRAVSLGPKVHNSDFFADVLLRRSLLRFRQGEGSAALVDLDRARAEAAKIQDPSRLERFGADLALSTGVELLEQDPAAAVDVLRGALDYFEKTQHWSRLLTCLEARAQAYGRLQNKEAELRDLTQALDLYAAVGRELKEDSFRISLAKQVESSYDQAYRLYFERSPDPEESLHKVEEERALSYPFLQHGSWKIKAADIAEVRAALTPDMAVVEYVVIADRIFIWVVSKTKVSFCSVTVKRSEMSSMLESFLEDNWSTWGHAFRVY
jgi:tetratricopeptide (TPR) repeat protein